MIIFSNNETLKPHHMRKPATRTTRPTVNAIAFLAVLVPVQRPWPLPRCHPQLHRRSTSRNIYYTLCILYYLYYNGYKYNFFWSIYHTDYYRSIVCITIILANKITHRDYRGGLCDKKPNIQCVHMAYPHVYYYLYHNMNTLKLL